MSAKQRLIVIGNGMAGARLVEDLLARGGGDKYEIVMFGDEPYGNYNRILLSGVLSGTHDPKEIFINPLSWYLEKGIRLHSDVRVSAIDRERCQVLGGDTITEPYDQLVIATGSRPFVPPIEGLRLDSGRFKEGVFLFRTLQDCDGIIKFAGRCRKAVVIGGGLLGLEAARGLLNLGVETHVVHLMSHLMEVQLDGPAGAVLKNTLEHLGVQVHLEKLTTAILGNDEVKGLQFKDGTTLDCDMVVISAGIRANSELAQAAGLKVERGIVVNDFLNCPDDPKIFAVGECAQHRGQVYGLVAPLWEQTAVLADRLSGRNPQAVYSGSKVSTKLKVMGVELAVMGDKQPREREDEEVSYVERSRGIYKKLIIRNGQLAGAILLGDSLRAASLHQYFDQGSELPENRAELLFPMTGEAKPLTMAYVPDSAQICNCNGVSKGRLVQAIQSGCCRSLKSLCDATRAGTGCGSCKPQVQAILEMASDGLMVEDPSAHYYVPGIPLAKPALIQAIKEQGLRSVSAVFEALAGGREDAGSKVGLASLLKTVWGKDYDDERDARFINDRVHANVQKDRTFSVIPRIYGGVTSAAELRRIADVAEKYSVPMVKITGGQRIDLLGISKENLPKVWQDLGMPSGHAYTKAFRTCKTCVGTEFCRYGVGDSTTLGIQIEKRFQGIESPHKMKLAAAGCPRNCSEATTKDLGAVAIEGGRWEIYIGGAAGSRVRKGDILCVVDTHQEVLKFIGRFMQYYRENGKYLERTYDFVERIGIERLRRLLVDDSEGICPRLDEEIQAAVDAYADPWQEAVHQAHPTQFLDALAPVKH
ncbi:MAG: nitrite reductase large subunit NirB [Acidobacteria bacterium]|nr:nitrite reductase large subunit NirB [Acidobacteriota bacterium]MCI0620901.1 nitrite reductase large subunit NirB [Acidobacteriota bacterium]MCI0720365.1 nitrite reductase large subunit NirB [Acidobacteriota bacterium]